MLTKLQTNVKIDPKIYNKAYRPYLNLKTRNQIFYGGSSSGKSFFLAQRAVKDLLQGGRNYLIIRQVSNTVRSSVFNEVCKAILSHQVDHLFDIRRSDMEITCLNGYQMLFKGLDDEEKIKSVTPQKGVITDIWQEEATENSYEATKQLSKRLRGRANVPKRHILSFNPIYKSHWIFTSYFSPIGWTEDQKEYHDTHTSILKTTYQDNDFLMPDDIYALENEGDEYYREVYTYGNWGIIGDVVFTNWRVEDIDDMIPSFDNISNGLDFGFSNDPTAYTRSHYQSNRKRLYIFDDHNEKEMTNPDIAAKLKPIVGKEVVWCDSAEPKSIQELKEHGINARGARKGKDSILHGIQWLQQQEIIISHRCQSVANEFALYQWQKDKDGNSINKPIDKHNHHIDGLRYAYENEQGRVFKWAG